MNSPAAVPIIELEGVSLCYRLAKQRIPSFKDYAIHFVRGALSYEQLWALRDVDLTIGRGETLGIVGRNGAGKSTLLKVISNVIKPTAGRVVVGGTVAPILELTTGFDAELSGRENIYLNALLLGRKRREVAAMEADIVAFSELEEFILSPVRNYSSGMLARLGFAIATAWIPDVLILDEVLAVGDAAFTQKCEQRLARFHAAGTTILMVSHSPEAIRKNCSRCIWLDGGLLRAEGTPDDVLLLYRNATAVAARPPAPAPPLATPGAAASSP